MRHMKYHDIVCTHFSPYGAIGTRIYTAMDAIIAVL